MRDVDRRLADRLRQHVAQPGPAVDPRPAATVILLRDSDEGPAVLLTERPASMAFAATMTVFPGGVVDPSDEQDAAVLGRPAVEVAAVRETFEEVGVWLAEEPAGSAGPAGRGVRWRADLVAHRRGLGAVLAEAGVGLAAGGVRPWSRWVTPTWSDRRYDTHFFVARCPAGQEARGDPRETTRLAWRPAATALLEAAEGRRRMMTPTLRTLAEIAARRDVEDVLTHRRAVPAHTFVAGRDDDRIRVYVETGGERDEAWSIPVEGAGA